MANFKRKKKQDEIRFHIALILVERMGFYEANQIARRIYADIVAPAVDEERKSWEEVTRAKDKGFT